MMSIVRAEAFVSLLPIVPASAVKVPLLFAWSVRCDCAHYSLSSGGRGRISRKGWPSSGVILPRQLAVFLFGGVAEWLKQAPAKRRTAVQFRSPPRTGSVGGV